MIKTLHILLIAIFLSTLAFGQTKNGNPHLLWEITHDQLDGASYLFGTIHLNDSRVFNFDDTLYQALMSCSQFAGEVDLSILDSLVLKEFESMFSQEDENSEDSSETVNEGDPFDFGFDKDGEITIQDFYLTEAARHAGLEISGLEEMSNQLDLVNSLEKQELNYKVGTPIYEDLVNAYLLRDLNIIEAAFIVDEFAADFDMNNRNKIQAAAFDKLMFKANSFGIVGLGHLIGDSSVLHLLEEKGYSIRRMNYGSPSEDINKLYKSGDENEWHTIATEKYSLKSNIKTDLSNFEDQGKVHISTELNKGLLYFSMFFPPIPVEHEQLINRFLGSIFSDTTDLRIIESNLLNDNLTTRFENISKELLYKGQLVTNSNLTALQMVIGFSKNSVHHPHVDRYLNGLTIQVDTAIVWTSQQSDYGGFEYFFPNQIEFETLESKMPEHETSGNAIVKYKTFTDNESKNEYLIRHVTTPPGILYVDPYESIASINKLYKTNYKGEIKNTSYSLVNGNLICDITIIDEYKNAFYIKTIIRGALMYNLIQKSPNQQKDDFFFEGFKLISSDNKLDKVFTYEDADFTIHVPVHNSFQQSKKAPDSTIDSYGINSSQTGINIDLEFDEYTRYQMNELHDTLFTADILEYDNFDSLLYFKKYMYQDICPGYITSFKTDSTYLIQTELGIYCNDHFTDINISIPQEIQDSKLVDNIINSIQFKNPTTTSITSDKTGLIIDDLMSSDSNQFNLALAALDEDQLFSIDHIPAFIKLLGTKVQDEAEDYNSKYKLITAFHDIESDLLENALFELYRKTDNLSVQYRILESLSARATKNGTDKLISLLQQPKLDNLYPEDLLFLLNDSLELFESYYPDLKTIAEINFVDDTALHSIVNWYAKDTSHLFTDTETMWLIDKINLKIEEYYTNSLIDTSASIQEYIMDFLDVEDLEAEEKLHSYLTESQDIFGQYRTIYSKLISKETISPDLLDKVMSNEYYKYWLLVNYKEENKALPDKYLDKKSVALIIMKKYIYDNFGYWCDTGTVLKEYNNGEIKYGDMLYVKCDYSEEGQYFIGCVGPFDGQGQFSFDDDESVYYQSIQTAADPLELEKELIDYLNKE